MRKLTKYIFLYYTVSAMKKSFSQINVHAVQSYLCTAVVPVGLLREFLIP